MTPERVIISAVLGKVHCVALVPPVPGQLAALHLASYDEAVGYAMDIGARLGREIVDETGRLSAVELAAARAVYAIGLVDEVLADLAQDGQATH